MTARDALREGAARLEAAGVPSPRVDAEFLLAHVLGTTRSGLAFVDEVGPVEPYWALIARREAREPLAYVLGEWGFRGLTLKVDRRVLVPRPETEIVVERCLALLDGPAAVVDVGVGSGAIALAIAVEHPGARVTGIDSSPARSRSRARMPPRSGSTSSCSRATPRGSASASGTSSSPTRRTWIRPRWRRWSRRCASGSRATRSSGRERPR